MIITGQARCDCIPNCFSSGISDILNKLTLPSDQRISFCICSSILWNTHCRVSEREITPHPHNFRAHEIILKHDRQRTQEAWRRRAPFSECQSRQAVRKGRPHSWRSQRHAPNMEKNMASSVKHPDIHTAACFLVLHHGRNTPKGMAFPERTCMKRERRYW